MKKNINKFIIGFELTNQDMDISKELTKTIMREIDESIKGVKKKSSIFNYLVTNKNFFATSLKEIQKEYEEDTNITRKVLEIIYNYYLSTLDSLDRFYHSKNFIIYKEKDIINIIGHISLNDIQNINSQIIKKEDRKKTNIIFYEIIVPGEYKLEDVIINVDEEGNITTNAENVEYGKLNSENNILDIKNPRFLSYDLTPIIISILNNKKKYIELYKSIDRELVEKSLYYILKKYIDNIDITEVLKENGFNILDKAYDVITNASKVKLMNSISGSLLDGRISISTDRGYQSRIDMPQQDAALSIVKNENCFLNIIADGAGGSENGEKASKLLIEEIKNWFMILPDNILTDMNLVIELLKHKINQLDNLIFQKYENSYTTMVLALTIDDKTIIANIGDSTAYTYNEEDDTLVELTTLDSDSKGLDYEEARLNPWNNSITSAIGGGYNDPLHINVIDNTGQKIILSSDGVTDLISEERFKTYFKKEITTKAIINDALSKEDTEYLKKTEDNISVIIIELKDYRKNKVKTK